MTPNANENMVKCTDINSYRIVRQYITRTINMATF